jgi:hypothetical protein
MTRQNLTKIFLFIIIILAFFLRIYQLDTNPPSLSWDEAAAGYNAYTIANYGADEWGQKYPLVFTSFLDDKHPVWIYFTALTEKLLGLSEFSTRLPAALFGVFNVLLVFLVAKVLFKSDLVGLSAALFLAISPFNLQFSRGEWEANFALFFFMLGLWAFLKAVDNPKKGWLIIVSLVSFGVDLFAYHSAKVVVPPILTLLFILYFKKLLSLKGHFYIGISLFVLFILILVTNPRVLGLARVTQTGVNSDVAQNTQLYAKTHNLYLGYGEVVWDNYLTHLTPQFLFESGDPNPRLSTQAVGEFYKVDLILFILGILSILLWYRSKAALILVAWILLAPMPAALTREVPEAHRALYMMGSYTLLAALGAGAVISHLKWKYLRFAGALALLLTLAVSLKLYLGNYYTDYPKRSAIDWEYGMKQVVEYVNSHPEYHRIYMTAERHQPYIFFLYYLKYPVDKFQESVVYNQTISRSYNLVSSFDKYHFGDWGEPRESSPNPGVLYVVTPSEYDGLRYKAIFKVKDLVKYPDNSSAFYLVSIN